MKCLIPVNNIEKLTKKIDHIRNKGGNIIFNVGSEEQMVKDDFGYYHNCVEVEVEGKYVINGWEFVATLEHTGNGNIIRCVIPEMESQIPSKYKTCGPECEHCHRIRDRKDTYLVYNETTKEFKQVGKQCLMDYTGGLDAEVCASMASSLDALTLAQIADDDDFFNFGRGGSSYVDNNQLKNYAYEVVKQYGYIKNDTVGKICDAMWDNTKKHILDKTPDNENELKKIDEWMATLDTESNDYIRNATLAWKMKYVEYKDFPLIASFINYYFKAQQLNIQRAAQEKHNQETTNYVGNVGEKITFKVASVKVLYQKDNSQYSYYAQPSNVYKLIDDKGNVYKWNASADVNEGDTITATIKAHEEYRGERQTVITRGKIQ